MNCHKNRFAILLLSIVLISPMVAGEWLHRFWGCSDGTYCSQSHQEENQLNFPQNRQNQAPQPVTPGKGSCQICKFLSTLQVDPVIVDWLPETLLSGNLDVVPISLLVTLYQNFEYGRAPPSFA